MSSPATSSPVVSYTTAFLRHNIPLKHPVFPIALFPPSYKSHEVPRCPHVFAYVPPAEILEESSCCFLWYGKTERYAGLTSVRFEHKGEAVEAILAAVKIHFPFLGAPRSSLRDDVVFSVDDFSDELASCRGGIFGAVQRWIFEEKVLDPLFFSMDETVLYIEDRESAARQRDPEPSTLRSWDSLVEAYKKFQGDQRFFFFSPCDTILLYLPYTIARQFLQREARYTYWETEVRHPYTPDSLLKDLRGKFEFFLEKLERGRGMSVERGMVQIKTMMWLMDPEAGTEGGEFWDLEAPEEFRHYVAKRFQLEPDNACLSDSE